MKKVEYITDVTFKAGKIVKSSLVAFTRPQYVETGPAVFKSLKPLVHSFVRDLSVAEYNSADILVRLSVKQLSHKNKLESTVKVVSVNGIE